MHLELPIVPRTVSSVDEVPNVEVLFLEPHETEYPDDKVYIDCPKEANTPISSIDWEITHRDFNKRRKLQEVDLSAVDLVIDALQKSGFVVAITERVADRLEQEDFTTSRSA